MGSNRSHVAVKIARVFDDLPDRFSLQQVLRTAELPRGAGFVSSMAENAVAILEDSYGCVRVRDRPVMYRKKAAAPIGFQKEENKPPTRRRLHAGQGDKFTLPLFPLECQPARHPNPATRMRSTATSRALSVIETIRQSCHIDEGGHWIWTGNVRYYGAPCMTYQRTTRPVRQVIQSLMVEDYQPGKPLLPRCGNPLCVAPACILPRRNADLMTEARRRKAKGVVAQIVLPRGIWDQLMTTGRK